MHVLEVVREIFLVRIIRLSRMPINVLRSDAASMLSTCSSLKVRTRRTGTRRPFGKLFDSACGAAPISAIVS